MPTSCAAQKKFADGVTLSLIMLVLYVLEVEFLVRLGGVGLAIQPTLN